MASFASRAVCLLLISLALCQAAAVEATAARSHDAKTIVAVFGEITYMSATLRGKAELINPDIVRGIVFLSDLPTDQLRLAAEVGQGFAAIIAKVGQATTMIGSMGARTLADPDAEAVVVALTTFVKVHQQLLNVVIGKSGLLARVPLLNPIRSFLVALEKVVDSFAFALIAVIPTRAPAAKRQFMALKGTVVKAESAYAPVLDLFLLDIVGPSLIPGLLGGLP